MELRVLRYFLAVAREESISRAAETLHLTQPTLSRQLTELEEKLGKKLLIRGNRRIILTEDGLLLRKRASEIIDLVKKAESDLAAPAEAISGEICIGGGETTAMRLIARLASSLQQEYPDIRYHLFSGSGDKITEKLDKGLLDFGVLIGPVDLKKYNYIPIPATDIWGILMPKGCPLSAKESISPQDLADLPIITSGQSLVSNEISSWLGFHIENLTIVATYNLAYNASLMVDEGFGYALCLDKLVSTGGDGNLCFRPLSPHIEASLSIVWKKYQVFSSAAEKFLQKTQTEFGF